jgi:hypothetical protein
MMDSGRDISVVTRLGRVVLVVSAIAAAAVLAVTTGVITLGFGPGGESAQARAQTSLVAKRSAVDQRWASVACTSVLDWEDALRHDATGLDLGFGPLARIKNAIAVTGLLLSDLDTLGLPPGGQTASARTDLAQLRSTIESGLHELANAAGSVANGNVLGIGILVGDLAKDRAVAGEISSELGHFVSVDLGVTLAETPACGQLVGIRF